MEINFDAVRINSSKLLHAATSNAGVGSYDLVGRSLQHSPSIDAAEDFLVASRLTESDLDFQLSVKGYFNDSATSAIALVDSLDFTGQKELSLPDPGTLTMSLQTSLKKRRSGRQYTGDRISITDLSAVLSYACGITASAEATLENGDVASLRLRSYASAGGLYGIQVLVHVSNVGNLQPGIYRFSPNSNSLFYVKSDARDESFRKCFVVPEEVISLTRANFTILLLGRPWRFMRKYGPRGMRFLFYEAGAISQNIHLVAASLGLGSVDCGSVIDDAMHKYLGVDGLYTCFVHSVVIGECS